MTATGHVCPMCLTSFSGHETDGTVCPHCRAGDRPVMLMTVGAYLAQVDFDRVEAFWREAPGASPDLRGRMLDRVARLRRAQGGGPATAGGVLIAGR